jgi:CDP-2,3-bis-(O-geranylgeranyl)-sn-glycerol synthase
MLPESAWLAVQLLFLLVVANGMPIIMKRMLADKGAWPVDGGWNLPLDGHPLLGKSKTWRGIVFALLGPGLASVLMGCSFELGVFTGLWAMVGDLFSSFIKRRLALPPSSMALGLDQVPESLFPLWAIRSEWVLTPGFILVLVMAFLVLELSLSRWLHKLQIREQPY